MGKNFSIKSWSEQDRPREKMLLHGRQALSDAELIAIIIGSGTSKESAVTLSQKILKSVNNDLNLLGRKSISELIGFKGIGEAKAVSICAALELGRRRQVTDIRSKPQISSSSDAYQLIAALIEDLQTEQFWMILLNRANLVIGKKMISRGGVSGTVVDAKLIFKSALDALASSVILVHNHPSGNLTPSNSDRMLTSKLVEAGKIMDVKVVDHLIISDQGYLSFADEGWI